MDALWDEFLVDLGSQVDQRAAILRRQPQAAGQVLALALDGATLYCTMEPCRVCAMLVVSVGIRRVVAKRRYHAAHDTRQLFAEAGVELVVAEDVVEGYEGQ